MVPRSVKPQAGYLGSGPTTNGTRLCRVLFNNSAHQDWGFLRTARLDYAELIRDMERDAKIRRWTKLALLIFYLAAAVLAWSIWRFPW